MAKILKILILLAIIAGILFTGYLVLTGRTKTITEDKDLSLSESSQTISPESEEISETETLSAISTIPSEYSIQADVKLNGSGTGYHAKLVACTKTSAVSFGIQYDEYGEGEFNDQTTFIIENIESNNPGGQEYIRTGLSERGQFYNLMLTVQKDGTCNFYVNNEQVGSVVNPELAGQKLYLRVEGSGRINGDTVEATFENIKLKGSGNYNAKKNWGTYNFDTNAGIQSDTENFKNQHSISIQGTVKDIGETDDWDSAYEEVSGIIQFVE